MRVDTSQVLSRLQRLASAVPSTAEKAVATEAAALLRESQALAPVQTGTLRDSAFVDASKAAGQATATLGYSAPYATEVHEDLNGSSPKFLEKPLQNYSAIQADLAATLRPLVRG